MSLKSAVPQALKPTRPGKYGSGGRLLRRRVDGVLIDEMSLSDTLAGT